MTKVKMSKISCLILILGVVIKLNAEECKPSITTASGSKAPQKICSGQLIFDDSFDKLDKNVWKPEVTFHGGGVS